MLRFGKLDKLSPRFIRPYEVIECVGPVAYRIALPPSLSRIHNDSYISMLRRCRSDPSHILQEQPVELKENLSYKEKPILILASDKKVLRNKVVLLVIVLWNNHSREEVTWERDKDMRQQYPYLFDSGTN